MRLIAVLFWLLSLSVHANAQESEVPVHEVLSSISDYQDTVYYRAVLVQGEEDADLYIYTRPDFENMELTVFAPGIAVTGIGGTDAYLLRNDAANLQLVSHNPAIGRHRWEQKLTIAYRNEQFVVSGYTYSYYDTVATDSNGEVKTGHCDVNLLTGKGIKDEKPFRTDMRSIPVRDWTVDTQVEACFEE